MSYLDENIGLFNVVTV